MTSIVQPTAPSNWEDHHLSAQPNPDQLDNIKAQLDLILLALEAIANLSSEAMLQAATELNLESMISDRVSLWRLRQSSPLRKGQGGRKKLDVDEARALTLIICHLAKQQNELVRRAVALLEQLTEQNREPHQAALLGNYLDAFHNTYQERMEQDETVSTDALTNLALKLLIDLLFYGSPQGVRRLWLTLLDRSLPASPN
ncbi:MAG: DUF3038 domain-containing protein [Plectolyngbya sp. WJT66-NPBG17]|jgi:hypothetical protein|nr:DUF3038 domain-containing protein [Plectolyngbya sp. WJT66-NPBG17]MBW4524498.1 DUF3038 domain-containing protein [Phormidium tanganyikae FI6-MK23]